MARPDDELGSEDAIRRSVGRILANWTIGLVSLAIIVGWGSTGIYQLAPGESAVILRLGQRDRTVVQEGLNWHYPAPIETIEIVNVSAVRQQPFGLEPAALAQPGESAVADDGTPRTGDATTTFENAMQTADNNIVNLGYVLKYEVQDAFAYLYGMADPEKTLFDATRSAVREVVGRMKVDDALYDQRQSIEVNSQELLQQRLDEYFASVGTESAFRIRGIELQVVQPPAQVQEAFDEIIAAAQDEERAISEAKGDSRETIERATAKAIELEQSSLGYKSAKVFEAQGRASRFEALLTEYRLAPEVMRQRLYLETMEEILPEVDKMVVEPGTASVLPMIQMGVAPALVQPSTQLPTQPPTQPPAQQRPTPKSQAGASRSSPPPAVGADEADAQ